MATKLKFGLLLPHFCEYASTEACIEGSKKAEAYGFDSVWVRDHLVFEPHGMEGEDNHHIEGLLILAAISSVCKKLTLGTGTVIAHRHPEPARVTGEADAAHLVAQRPAHAVDQCALA